MENNSIQNERELFARISEGDEDAFLKLFHLYVSQVKPVIVQIIKNESIVPDLVQDIFLRIWLGREKLTEVQSPRSWIFSVVYHQCFNHLRKQAVRSRSEKRAKDTRENENVNNSPETTLLFNETKQHLRQAVDRLAPKARKVYLLSREEGLKINEIAECLHIAPKTVKNTLTRASASIREYLSDKGIYLPALLATACKFL